MKETKWTAQIMLQSNRLTRVEFFSPSNLREDAEATVKALYGVTDVRQLRRIWSLIKFSLYNIEFLERQMLLYSMTYLLKNLTQQTW